MSILVKTMVVNLCKTGFFLNANAEEAIDINDLSKGLYLVRYQKDGSTKLMKFLKK
jgi:hypothetical protein